MSVQTMRRAIIDLRPGRCTCGCGTPVRFTFKQGHAQFLKSTLRAAQAHSYEVTVKIGRTEVELPVEQAVTYLDGPDNDWSKWLAGDAK